MTGFKLNLTKPAAQSASQAPAQTTVNPALAALRKTQAELHSPAPAPMQKSATSPSPKPTGLAALLAKSKKAPTATATGSGTTAHSAPISGIATKPVDSIITDLDIGAPASSLHSQPTVEDVAKYVFEEQSDTMPEEVVAHFRQMQQELEGAVGSEIRGNLERCMSFIKDHAEVAAILKPEDIGKFVRAARKAYGSAAATAQASKTKRSKADSKVDEVVDMLAGF